jgi:predicted CXXCH cytochrome family protein
MDSQVEPVVQSETVVTLEDSHPDLREGKDLAIDACYQCHPAEELGVSHPVGVRPSAKTVIPDDLPTLTGGILTCSTCHDPHGGIRRYFARKDIKKDICVSCHEGY